MDPDHFHRAVHGSLDYDRYLKPDMQLREILLSVQLSRFVFTNADQAHAERCLQRMGIADCFQVWILVIQCVNIVYIVAALASS